MKKIKVKKDYRTIIINKNIYNTNRMPSLTVIRRKTKMWNLKEEDILDIIEFTSSYHIKIRDNLEYNYDYSNIKKYKHYSRDYYRKQHNRRENAEC